MHNLSHLLAKDMDALRINRLPNAVDLYVVVIVAVVNKLQRLIINTSS